MRQMRQSFGKVIGGATRTVRNHPYLTFFVLTGAVLTFNRFVAASGVEDFTTQDLLKLMKLMNEEDGLIKLKDLGALDSLVELLGLPIKDVKEACPELLSYASYCRGVNTLFLVPQWMGATCSREIASMVKDPVTFTCNIARLMKGLLSEDILEACEGMVGKVVGLNNLNI